VHAEIFLALRKRLMLLKVRIVKQKVLCLFIDMKLKKSKRYFLKTN